MESKIAQRLWDVIRAVCYMLRKSVSKRKLMLEVQHLLHRGKLAGKAIANLITLHPHHHHDHNNYNYHIGAAAVGGGLSADANSSFFFPQEIEFSCSSTPANRSCSKKRNNRRRHNHDYLYNVDAAAIAGAFEVMSSKGSDAESVAASPFPLNLSVMKRVRSVRITDSPFPIKEEDGEYDVGRVDRAAEEFIKRFYEQLQRQEIAGN